MVENEVRGRSQDGVVWVLEIWLLEIHDATLCAHLVEFIDEVRSRYPRAPLPPSGVP